MSKWKLIIDGDWGQYYLETETGFIYSDKFPLILDVYIDD